MDIVPIPMPFTTGWRKTIPPLHTLYLSTSLWEGTGPGVDRESPLSGVQTKPCCQSLRIGQAARQQARLVAAGSICLVPNSTCVGQNLVVPAHARRSRPESRFQWQDLRFGSASGRGSRPLCGSFEKAMFRAARPRQRRRPRRRGESW